MNSFDFKDITKTIWFKIAIVAIVLVLVYFIIDGIRKSIANSDNYSRDARAEFSNYNLSFTDLEFENMATRLLGAMSSAGTNEIGIYEILRQLKTKDDWYKLVNVFGVRETTSMWSSWTGNLIEWLVDELDGVGEQETISEILGELGVQF